MNEYTWIQSNWYALGNLLAQFAFLASCRHLVCPQNPANHARFPGAVRGPAQTLDEWPGRGAPVDQRHRRANSEWCEPLLAYTIGNSSCQRAGTPSKRSEPLACRPAQTGRVVANAHEHRRSCSLAQSCQVAPGPRPKLTQARRSESMITGRFGLRCKLVCGAF